MKLIQSIVGAVLIFGTIAAFIWASIQPHTSRGLPRTKWVEIQPPHAGLRCWALDQSKSEYPGRYSTVCESTDITTKKCGS